MTYGTLPPGGYPGTSKFLHWLIALCVIVAVPLSIAAPRVAPGPFQNTIYDLHKSLGALILILMILRVLNRYAKGAPAAEPGLAAWQRIASSAVHGMLYALLVVQPLVGYFANAAFGAPQPFFRLFTLPPLIGRNMPLAESLFALHRGLGILIAILAVIHIAAALQHHFFQKDNVLRRMLPRALGGR